VTKRISAVIPYRRDSGGKLEILLVTSRRRRRWVLPKGKIKDGLLPNASAAREAYEEAGLIGTVSSQAIGSYHQHKGEAPSSNEAADVAVFPMFVLSENDPWPEMYQRERRWMTIEEASRNVRNKDVRRLFAIFRAGKKVTASSSQGSFCSDPGRIMVVSWQVTAFARS